MIDIQIKIHLSIFMPNFVIIFLKFGDPPGDRVVKIFPLMEIAE